MIPNRESAEERVCRMMASRTPLERLRMASRMFATGRTLVRVGMKESGERNRIYLFRRMYEKDFSPQDCERIIEHLTAFEGL